ncbi:MAG TPA: tRNA (guanosine(37)-N1)-methyltransferase TrmD [Chthonomonadaceae bacterium]|nr:tRNA (guanosine(37)-N1)-methyltransferase TrmD [Chthonomonadaceae bacterium]
MMRIDIVTVFPDMIAAALDHSIVKRAQERGLVTIRVVNLRDYTQDRHKTTDDIPYGGGGGMIMKIEPIARALDALTEGEARPRIALTDPRGPRFTQETARQWAQEPHLILLCGHYEGVDERVRQHLVTDEVSIGDYILTGGELPALVIADALTRLQPGALGDAEAPDKDTFAQDLLEYPHYTRPHTFQGWMVPDILLSGNHAQIERWRRWHQLHATRERRPDLFDRLELTKQDYKLLDSAEPQAPADAIKTLQRTHPAFAQETDAPTERMQEENDGTGTGNHS